MLWCRRQSLGLVQELSEKYEAIYELLWYTFESCTYGVPQGSVIRPLLFILYTNDIPRCLHHCKMILFADDTTIYITGAEVQTLYHQVNYDLDILDDWVKQTNCLLIHPRLNIYSSRGGILQVNMIWIC